MPCDNLAVDSLWLVTIAHSSLFSPPDSVRSHRQEKHPSSSGTLAGGRRKRSGRQLGWPHAHCSSAELGAEAAQIQLALGNPGLTRNDALFYLCLWAQNTDSVNVYGDKHILLPSLHAQCRVPGHTACLSRMLRFMVLNTFPTFSSSTPPPTPASLPSPPPAPPPQAHAWQVGRPPGIRLGGCYDVRTPGSSVSNVLDHGCLFLSLEKYTECKSSPRLRHSSKCPTWWAHPGPGERGGERECVMRVCSPGLLPSVSSVTTFSWQAIWPGSDLEYIKNVGL